MDRREELLDQVADHLLEHGLIGLTLRPLAAAIGTSDRMLVYHFGSRDALVSAAVGRVNERAVAAVTTLRAGRTVRAGVRALWAAYQHDPLNGYLTVYCQAAATGLLGQEPYLSDAREANERWSDALAGYLVRCGAQSRRVRRVVRLVDSALYGFHLGLATDRPEWLAAGVDDLARAAEEIASG